jgi:hypothetical protein
MKSLSSFLLTDHGPALHRSARVVGAVVALLITWAWLAGEAAYDLGRQLRLVIEERNDQLAALWVGVLGLTPAAAPAPVVVAAEVTPAAPAPVAPVALPAVANAPRKRKAAPGRHSQTAARRKAAA